MAKTKISEYDATAANNTDIDSINIAENCAPSGINNAIRQLMAHLKTEFFKTGSDNTSLGDTALDSLDGSSPGGNNTALGSGALTALTTGNDNVAVGFEALKTDTLGDRNVAIGLRALKTQNFTTSTASYNTAIGYAAGLEVTTGQSNTIVGGLAGDALTTGSLNTFVGTAAGSATDDGASNTAVGAFALDAGNCGDNNTAIGAGALGDSSHTGTDNTAVGKDAGNAITTGTKNTILGCFNGNQNSLDLTTSSNNIMLSDGDGNPRFWINSNGAVSATANGVTHPTGTQSYHMFKNSASGTYTLMARNGSASPGAHYMSELQFSGAAPNNTTAKFLQCRDTGGARLDIESNGDVKNANNTYGAISDEKLKENIVDSGSQWADIKAVKVRKYSFKTDELDAANRIGVIAQELEASGMNGLVDTQKDLNLETREELGTETKSVKYSVLYMKAVKALQEAMARIETLETKVAALEAE